MGLERHNWGKVIAISDYRKLPDLPEVAVVRDYWERLRAGRVAPARGEVDPKGIASALANAFILDRIAPGHARFRVAGMHLCDLMGMEVRGMPLSALFHISSRDQLSGLLGELFDGPCTLRIGIQAGRGLGRPALDGQMLLLPLTDRQGAITRALGCLVAQGEIGYPPRRFDLMDAYRMAITGHRLEAPAAAEPVSEPGFAEARAPYRGRPKLRVVQDDD